MTFGTGTLGGGGGGVDFFPGGKDDCEECDKCCDRLCNGLLFLLCLSKMKRRTRTCLIWFWVVVVPLTSGLALRFGRYKEQTISASPTDMRKVDGVSTVFCDRAEVTSDQAFVAYFLPSEPEVDRSHVTRYTLPEYIWTVDSSQYVFWGYYLLDGSNVTVKSCVIAGQVDLYTIKGSESFEDWKLDHSDANPKLINTSCLQHNIAVQGLNITDDDEYYFVFANPYPIYSNIKVTFSMYRTKYFLNNYTTKCKNSRRCSFPLSEDSSESVVYFVTETAPVNTLVRTECKPRVWVYLVLFLITPILMGVALSCALLFLCYASGELKIRVNMSTSASDRIALNSYEDEVYYGSL